MRTDTKTGMVQSILRLNPENGLLQGQEGQLHQLIVVYLTFCFRKLCGVSSGLWSRWCSPADRRTIKFLIVVLYPSSQVHTRAHLTVELETLSVRRFANVQKLSILDCILDGLMSLGRCVPPKRLPTHSLISPPDETRREWISKFELYLVCI